MAKCAIQNWITWSVMLWKPTNLNITRAKPAMAMKVIKTHFLSNTTASFPMSTDKITPTMVPARYTTAVSASVAPTTTMVL